MATRRSQGRPTPTLADLNAAFERRRQHHLSLMRLMRRKGAEIDDLRRRSRGKLSIAAARERVGYHPVWSRWSESYDEVSIAADRLVRSHPSTLADLLVMFRALEWILLTDAVIVDQIAERQLRTFGRRLRHLATTL